MLDDRTQVIFPARGVVDIPLLFEPQVLRCQAAGPSGWKLNVLLDTGTDPSAIDLGLVRRLGLRMGAFALGQDATGDAISFTETVVPWLRLGDLTIRDLFALALDLSAAPFPVDVVLGYNVLSQMVLQIDYAQRSVSLCHPEVGKEPSVSAAVLPITFFEHFPALTDVILCDTIHLPVATIDTGSNGGLTLGPDLAERMGLQRDAPAVTLVQGAGFASGECDVLRGQAESMHLGPFALRDVLLDTPGSGAGDLRRTGRANIGNQLLSRFARVTLDYERRFCAFEPHAPRLER